MRIGEEGKNATDTVSQTAAFRPRDKKNDRQRIFHRGYSLRNGNSGKMRCTVLDIDELPPTISVGYRSISSRLVKVK